MIFLCLFVSFLAGWFIYSGLDYRIANLESAVTEQANQTKAVNEILYGQIGPVMRKVVVDLYGKEVISATENVRAK